MKNKASLFVVFTLFLSLLLWSWNTKKQTSNTIGSEFVLMELFTSEGCSNCPAAEELFNEMTSKNEPEVYMISYHIDYWDKNGWKDAFSKNEFSQRQYEYSALFELKDHYTPQMVVNGTTHFPGSNKSKLQKAIKEKSVRENEISLEVSKEGNSISLDYKVFGEVSGKNLHLVLVQKEATTAVKAGENKGKTLKHTNIVLEYYEVRLKNTEGTKAFLIPDGINSENYFVLAFVQNGETKKVTGIIKI